VATLARKSAWTAGLAMAACALAGLSLMIVFDARGVLATTILAFLALSLIGWLAYNLASGEESPDEE